MSRTLVDKIIFEATLLEVGELNGKIFLYTKILDEKDLIQYEFQSESGKVIMAFRNVSNSAVVLKASKVLKDKLVYNVQYDVEGNEVQYEKTTYSVLMDILTTNLEIIKEFLNEKQPDALIILGNNKTEDFYLGKDEPIKSRLYGACIDKNLDKVSGYHLSTTSMFGQRVYALYK